MQTNETNLMVVINTTAPQEQKQRLQIALVNALKWYALNEHKTDEDVEHVCTLAELQTAILE